MHTWQAAASSTLVGSMPHQDRHRAIDLILQHTRDIPVWPQLAHFKAEQMMVQYLEGLPGVRKGAADLHMDTEKAAFEQELYDFYAEYLAVEDKSKDLDESRFRLGDETGRTFFEFLEAMKRLPGPCRAVKGQVVGPFTLLSGLKDPQERSLLYDERFQDLVPKHLAMKAKWQIGRLAALARPVILFMDEPALAGFGSSAFIGVSRELVQQLLQEVIDSIHAAQGLAGIHICANTDWLLTFDSDIDIINFDAYNYLEKFSLYKEAFTKFMGRGGIVAWGIVPTGDVQVLAKETAETLADRWMSQISALTTAELTREKILSQSLFTPSCGCGSLPEPAAERVVELTRDVGLIMQDHLAGQA